MSERQLLEAVRDLAGVLGWLVYHTHDSRKSEAGFPDLVLVHAGAGRILYRELKTSRGRMSRDQARWMAALAAAGGDAAVWDTADWVEGRIEGELRR